MATESISKMALRPWQVRFIISCIAAIPLIVACTLFETDAHFYRDLVKDLGIVIAGLFIVNLVWSAVGGDPLENDIKSLADELKKAENSLSKFSSLTESAYRAGLSDVGADASAFQYQPDHLLQFMETSRKEIAICGLTLLLLHENHNLIPSLCDAARRGVQVRILLAAADNPWLEASNDASTILGMAGVINSTIAMLRGAGGNGNPRFEVRVLRVKTLSISILRFDELLIATPYLISTMTPSSPRFATSGSGAPLFKVWMREFEYLWLLAERAW